MHEYGAFESGDTFPLAPFFGGICDGKLLLLFIAGRGKHDLSYALLF